MPTYQYACRDCGHAFDQFQSFTDDALTTCPECGGPLRKVFGNVGVVFKGSGFYKTDSRSSETGSAKPESKPGSKSESTSDSKAETKSETTTSTSTTTSEKKSDAAKSSSASTAASS